ncbi:MAG: hypothetical protein RL591_232 [Planctomycetota bacterium]
MAKPTRTTKSVKKTAKKVTKKSAKKSAKKVAKKTSGKVAKKVAKKVANKTSTKIAKKVAKQSSKKIAKKAALTPRTRATSIAAIAPIGKGDASEVTKWELMMEDGTSVVVNASAAQAIGLGVNAAWNATVAAKLAAAEDDQRSFTAAMQLLAQGKTAWTKASLLKKLGGDTRATRTVRALIESGWIR